MRPPRERAAPEPGPPSRRPRATLPAASRRATAMWSEASFRSPFRRKSGLPATREELESAYVPETHSVGLTGAAHALGICGAGSAGGEHRLDLGREGEGEDRGQTQQTKRFHRDLLVSGGASVSLPQNKVHKRRKKSPRTLALSPLPSSAHPPL